MKRKTDNFNKFYNKKSNAAIKEEFRQEKKAAKKERKDAIERHFEEKRKAREQQFAANEELKKLPGKKKPPTLTLKRGFAASADAQASNTPGSPAAKGFTPSGPAKASNTPQSGPAKASNTPQSGPAKASGPAPVSSTDPNALPLNKYIAHGGICSRRDAAELIRQGKVQVNGHTVTEPGLKVSPDDLVKFNGKKVTISRNFVYILLNKPKDYITTNDDPQGRKTVLDLIRQATTERVFPVGRLDRNTSGVLLLTNDGDLSQKLAHPKHEIKKIYHVTLDKPLTKADFDQIAAGVQLEDGIAYVDVLAYADSKDKTQIGLEIHSGRNRIVRRIFEHLGYDVRGLDRVMYAGLTKKNVQRGHWRLLTEKEIRILKYLNSSFKGSLSPNPKTHRPAENEDTEAVASEAAAERPSKASAPKKFNRPAPGGPKKAPRSTGWTKDSVTDPSKGSAARPFKGSGPSRASRPAKPSPERPSKASRPAPAHQAPNGGLRGRKSGGSYIKSKAKSQHASQKSSAPRSRKPSKPSGRRPH